TATNLFFNRAAGNAISCAVVEESNNPVWVRFPFYIVACRGVSKFLDRGWRGPPVDERGELEPRAAELLTGCFHCGSRNESGDPERTGGRGHIEPGRPSGQCGSEHC